MSRLTLLILTAAAGLGVAAPARAAEYRPRQVLVTMEPGAERAAAGAARAAGTDVAGTSEVGPTTVVHLARGETVKAAVQRLNAQPGVASAVPNYVARAAATTGFNPNDRYRGRSWSYWQWNFAGPWGVDAPAAWANAGANGRAGARGVRIAVVDSGVAYRNYGKWRKSPDFAGTRFLRGYDFVSRDPVPVDFYGHGTHVAGTIAEATGNGYGVAGLAYRASIIPVRVLDRDGFGDDATIAKGIRFAVRQHAKIINLSLEFPTDIGTADIPAVVRAVAYARSRGVLVIGAAGNEGDSVVSFPARSREVLAVGATTRSGCLAQYSNTGRGIDLVAPGGGDDADIRSSPRCNFEAGRPPVYQMTFTLQGRNRTPRFGLPPGYEGTSMATAHVTGIAALAIASGALGIHPSPSRIISHLERTARDLGPAGYDGTYGYGLVDGAAATARP